MTSKKIGITHANRSASYKVHIDKNALAKLNVYIFYFDFAIDIILCDRCDRKTPQNNFFIFVKPHLLVVEFGKNVTF